MTTEASAKPAATGSWVTITIVWPNSSRAARSNSSTSCPLRESRLPVGSSAKTICGRVASARATATRCCWPPESSAGRCPSRSASPVRSITVASQSGSGAVPASVIGSVMLSRADSVGTRLKAWNTNPIRSRRSSVSCRSDRAPSSTSPTKAFPAVSVSSPARQCSSVDLPDPDGPMIAVNRPAGNSTVTSSRAVTAVSPAPYTLTACSARTALRRAVLVCVVASCPDGRRRTPAASSARRGHLHYRDRGIRQLAQPGRTSPAS